MSSHKGFTFIELLVVIAIIAILSTVVVLTLNPAELLKESRDSTRLSDLNTLNIAVGLAEAKSLPLGNASTVYVSLPDPTLSTGATSTCSSLGLPSLPAGWTYQCSSPGSYRNINGTGWIPIAFNNISPASPFGSIPIDPVNTSSSYLFYSYTTDGTHYDITAHNESRKYQSIMWNDGGQYTDLYEQGTNLSLLPVDLGGGDVYVVDYGNSRIEDFTFNGTYLSQFGSHGSGNGQLWDPNGVATDGNGNIYVADGNNARIEEFSPDGSYLSQFGNSYLGFPIAIAIGQGGNIYVVDYPADNRVEEFSPNGTYITQFGSAGSGNGQFNNPEGIAIDGSGNVYVTDSGNGRVEEFSPNGTYITQFGSGYITNPLSIAINTRSGNIYVTDNYSNRVDEFSPSGVYITQFGISGGIAIDGSGNVYVTGGSNDIVEEFSPNGTYITQFGSAGSGNGQLNNAVGIGIQ